jgi:threonylcarbamoyladenosine tRNA methylthiotransferase MtaB
LVRSRAARLREAATARRSRWLDSLIGTAQPVLIENNSKGHTDTFAPIIIDGAARGETGLARIISRNSDHLTAVWA